MQLIFTMIVSTTSKYFNHVEVELKGRGYSKMAKATQQTVGPRPTQ